MGGEGEGGGVVDWEGDEEEEEVGEDVELGVYQGRPALGAG